MQINYTIDKDLFEFFLEFNSGIPQECQSEVTEPLAYDSKEYQDLIEELKL